MIAIEPRTADDQVAQLRAEAAEDRKVADWCTAAADRGEVAIQDPTPAPAVQLADGKVDFVSHLAVLVDGPPFANVMCSADGQSEDWGSYTDDFQFIDGDRRVTPAAESVINRTRSSARQYNARADTAEARAIGIVAGTVEPDTARQVIRWTARHESP